MRIINEFAPGAIAGGATSETLQAPALVAPASRPFGLLRRIKAIGRLFLRARRKASAIGQLGQLDAVTRRDLGLGERGWSAMDVAARVAAFRHQTEMDYLLSASSRFIVRNVDARL